MVTAHIPQSVRKDEKPKTHPRGRVCSRDGCTTPLSIYNPGTRCSLHGPQVYRASAGEQTHALEDIIPELMEQDS